MTRVLVTGIGVVAPCGRTADELFHNLVEARSAVSLVPNGAQNASSSLVAAQICFESSVHWPANESAQYDRVAQFALVASSQAMSDAVLSLGEDELPDAGVYWGSGLGGAATIEDSYKRYFESAGKRVRPTAVVLGMNNAAAAHVSMAHGFRGPMLNISTACSSSAASIGEAYRLIRSGDAQVMLAGGSEALITPGNLAAWDAMRALAHADPIDPARSCKPFSADRTGLVLGEGAAALVLESDEHAARRGARVYAELAGYGNASDASNISRPDPGGQVRAMKRALADAKLDVGDVGYLNAHGTATQVGDVVETDAVKQTFGCHARTLSVSSTKALHGHLLGAAGALEMVVAIMALARNVVPPTAHLDRRDPACDLDYVPNEARDKQLDAVMSNSFGFGGMNSVLVARRY
ncbi:MAG TPA: beta-ketoacyl-[acyl-carrier-protein] synthase family protein [Gemmatimonadaceae bacterium]|nr:beta-ketoacyl-[acyl-carrier-protein] synthase family protein [Gemmatimonadaceae bacterium]